MPWKKTPNATLIAEAQHPKRVGYQHDHGETVQPSSWSQTKNVQKRRFPNGQVLRRLRRVLYEVRVGKETWVDFDMDSTRKSTQDAF
ncbi:hypothetical protein Y032_0893g2908 [Ancylostoma ceylanicum]|uniref:Uncharacterized protein n=1 Tax=Ancylostoma ceylanicum TaxID=53326 RepID=A0A016WB29_9BILA|nr:hypothetical protein Y032_0893g2908 [Ancylostoma ceylanicum]